MQELKKNSLKQKLPYGKFRMSIWRHPRRKQKVVKRYRSTADLSAIGGQEQTLGRPRRFSATRPMFTQTSLHACVFVLKRFFCQMQCFDWLPLLRSVARRYQKRLRGRLAFFALDRSLQRQYQRGQ